MEDEETVDHLVCVGGDGRITAGGGCFQNGTLRPDHAWLRCHSRGFGPELVVA